ncbi:RNA polymerase sigma factor [Chitinophaga sp. GCM10012297]|uniref:Sigma-70 family RNA polymerase sigma factor n=1 Tax=Chitinophaga chungangae TaxID=2821488 RepID=A0ABS3YEA7_9BACT|nr:sigma-70 family RNA polymerase sigma factor [Chitinophaga chungangae]MBO9153015.1 sigma-70 family RNA polymerase sigma factor [Chitinophaga chungangae]
MSPHRQEKIEKNWQLLAGGDRQGLYECFDLFYDDLFRLGLSLYRDVDLVQGCINELFLELWKIRERLAGVQNIQQYVITIFKRLLYKSTNQPKEVPFDEAAHMELTQSSYEEMLIETQTDEGIKARLRSALTQLSGRQLQLVQLRYFEGRGFKEIAEVTGLTERTIYNTLHNALQVLRKEMN